MTICLSLVYPTSVEMEELRLYSGRQTETSMHFAMGLMVLPFNIIGSEAQDLICPSLQLGIFLETEDRKFSLEQPMVTSMHSEWVQMA